MFPDTKPKTPVMGVTSLETRLLLSLTPTGSVFCLN
jgi:hypothetical protein